MGYSPSWADPDVWMKVAGTHYDYVCVWVDDIAVMSLDSQVFFDGLTHRGYKLKGVGAATTLHNKKGCQCHAGYEG
jgi:hypothetical protein